MKPLHKVDRQQCACMAVFAAVAACLFALSALSFYAAMQPYGPPQFVTIGALFFVLGCVAAILVYVCRSL